MTAFTPSAAAADSATMLTSRGTGVGIAGIAMGGLGIGLAAPILLYIGVAMVCAVVVAALWIMLSVHAFLQRFPRASRVVTPLPLTVGIAGTVEVGIRDSVALAAALHPDQSSVAKLSSPLIRRTLLDGLDIREQAASELTGGAGTKATVARTAHSLTLRYELFPTQRGRWPLGPALVHTSDPLGMIHADTSVGEPELIPVWPRVIDLSGTAGTLMGHADRVVLGARTPSSDDAALRDYREGDDLRRVHWASSARRGSMLVRSDEHAGKRPATVLMDVPRDINAIEWTITASVSIALSVLESGHPVRLVGSSIDPDVAPDNERSPGMARANLLNSTVDLKTPVSESAKSRDFVRAARMCADSASQGEVIVAVLDPLSKEDIDFLVPIGEHGRAWALVRADGVAQQEAAETTARALRRAGWRASATPMRNELPTSWSALLASGDIE